MTFHLKATFNVMEMSCAGSRIRWLVPSYANARARWFGSCYGANMKRNRVPFVDFESGFPKQPLPPQTITTAFTVSKQERLREAMIESPQLTFKGRVIRQLSVHRFNFAGRNNTGRICSRHRGGRHAQRLRLIDFKRGRKDIFATVLRIEYDASRTAHIALVQYDDGVLSYILAPLSLRPGDRVIASASANITAGNCLPFRNIPVGSMVHNLELRPGAGGQFIRAAGTHALVISKSNKFATVKLKSTEIRNFPLDCWATIGQLSNLEQSKKVAGKAGAKRWVGRRPVVRGVAMNPCDHPHGGGTAAKHTKRPPVSKWGILIDGYKKRCPTKPLGHIVARKLPGKKQKVLGVSPW